MKLFMVNGITIRHGDPSILMVAENEKEAEERMLKPDECGYTNILEAYAHEITKIDGYKVTFHKGKKINLIK